MMINLKDIFKDILQIVQANSTRTLEGRQSYYLSKNLIGLCSM
jgi:hypothetical protein